MASALVSRSSDPGLNPSRGHCVVFLGKILHFHSATPHPGVQMVGIGELMIGGNPAMDQEGEETLLVTSCCRNRR